MSTRSVIWSSLFFLCLSASNLTDGRAQSDSFMASGENSEMGTPAPSDNPESASAKIKEALKAIKNALNLPVDDDGDISNPPHILQGASEPDETGWKQGDYPGIHNRCVRNNKSGEPLIELWYPVLENPVMDASIQKFVQSQTGNFLSAGDEVDRTDPEAREMLSHWELSGIFFVSRPSDRVISLTFNIYRFSGGAHGNISIDCLNYDVKTGKLLDFSDIFANPQLALALMSELSAKKLTKKLGEDGDEEMISYGTAPDETNFKNLTLIPDGLIIEFQPYQVGPWSIGPQRIKLSLEELAPAFPNPLIWN